MPASYYVEFSENNYKIFNSMEELCAELKISDFTAKSIMRSECKFNTKKTSHLKGVIIGNNDDGKLGMYDLKKKRQNMYGIVKCNLYIEISDLKEKIKSLKAEAVPDPGKMLRRYKILTNNGLTKYFKTIEVVCLSLGISKDTAYSIIRGECDFNHPKTAHLKGTKIFSLLESHSKNGKKIKHYEKIMEKKQAEYAKFTELLNRFL